MCSKRVDPAAALIDYARHNQVDHIVIGARASSAAAPLSRQRLGAGGGGGAVHRDGGPRGIFVESRSYAAFLDDLRKAGQLTDALD